MSISVVLPQSLVKEANFHFFTVTSLTVTPHFLLRRLLLHLAPLVNFSTCPKLEKVKLSMNLSANNTDVSRPVARIVNYLQKHLVGRTLAVVKAQHDENVFGKVGTSGAEFEKALRGKKVLSARQQGKYFWYDIFFLFMVALSLQIFSRS